jgi:hypothetical protein
MSDTHKYIVATGVRTGRSVAVTYTGPYSNNRPPHVQTEDDPMEGAVFLLSDRIHKKLRCGKHVVMYTVHGLKSGKHKAHFTVYCGSTHDMHKY